MTDLQKALEKIPPEELPEIMAMYYLQLDFEEYAAEVLKVQPMEGGALVPFILNQPQRILLAIINHIREQGRLVRITILKGRRHGISTLISGLGYQNVSNNRSFYCFQITHQPSSTNFLFRMVKRFYYNSPKTGRPKEKANNAKILEFNNDEGTGLDSAFQVATAGTDNIGAGQNINILHLSEFALWPAENASKIEDVILPCVPKTPDSMVVRESTAFGVGGPFYTRFWGARYRYWCERLEDDGTPIIQQFINKDAPLDNAETSVFFPWYIFEKNKMTAPFDFVLTKDTYDLDGNIVEFGEESIKAKYNLSMDQMYWRRYTIENEFKGDVRKFAEAHPGNPTEAFISTGTPYFDNFKIQQFIEKVKDPRARYECQISTMTWISDKEGRLEVWDEPRPGQSYIVSADVSEGLVEGDFNSADVINHRTGDQVAHWHGKCSLNEFGDILIALGRRYNNAYVAPERNNAGVTVVQRLFDAHYPRLHVEMIEEPPNKPRPRYGWHTSEKTRHQILDNLKCLVAFGTHGIKCKETLNELLTFQRDKTGKYQAQEGSFDDRVLSYAIGQHIRKVVPVPLPPPPSNIIEPKGWGGGAGGSWGGA